MSFWGELRRRNVVRVGLAYLAAAWLLLQVASIVLPAFEAPPNLMPALIVLFALGFAVTLILAWVFELTPEGLKRTEDAASQSHTVMQAGRRLDFAIIGILAMALTVVVIDQYVLGPARVPAYQSIAVLPLVNLSGDIEQEYFADGMTEALIASLAKLETLRVISRTSAMRYKHSDKPLPQIAAELNVDAVIEGSAVRVGDRMRITAQLIDAESDQHVWAESYDRDLQDVLLLQSEIARAVASAVEIELSSGAEERLAGARPVDPQTYEAYLRGMFHLHQFTPDGFERGLAYMQDAIERDPADPLAYAGLALVLSLASTHSPTPPPDAFYARAREATLRALALDDRLPEAHAALGQIKLYQDWDWAGAKDAFERALELNPNLAPALGHYAWYLDLSGRHPEAEAAMNRARQVDPLTPVWSAWIGDLNWSAGNFDRAIQALQRSLELDPEFPPTHHMLGLCYDAKGLSGEAITAHEKATQLNPGYAWGLAYTYALAGRQSEARVLAAQMETAPRPNAWGLASIYTGLGDHDAALRWLETAYRERDAFLPWIGKVPIFQALRDDRRFLALLQGLNLPEQGG